MDVISIEIDAAGVFLVMSVVVAGKGLSLL